MVSSSICQNSVDGGPGHPHGDIAVKCSAVSQIQAFVIRRKESRKQGAVHDAHTRENNEQLRNNRSPTSRRIFIGNGWYHAIYKSSIYASISEYHQIRNIAN
jgi:hypothetical protein